MAIRSLKTGSFSRSTQVGNQVIMPGSYESIATVTPYTTTSTVVFSSIPSTYQHLQIRGFAAGSTAANITVRFNNNSATNYSWHYFEGTGAGTSTGSGADGTYILGPVVTNTASAYTSMVMDVLDYSNTNKNKTTRIYSGVDLNGSNTWLNMFSGAWYNNTSSAINSITLTLGGGTFTSNSHWALYGVK
jgi:hypothetical protein